MAKTTKQINIDELKAKLQTKYKELISKEIDKAIKNKITYRLVVDVQGGFIQSLRPSYIIAGQTIMDIYNREII